MRAIANEQQAEEMLTDHQVNHAEGLKRTRSQFEEDSYKRQEEIMAELMFLKKARADEQGSNHTSSAPSGHPLGKLNSKSPRSFLGFYPDLQAMRSINEVSKAVIDSWREHKRHSAENHRKNTCRGGKCWMNKNISPSVVPKVIQDFMKM